MSFIWIVFHSFDLRAGNLRATQDNPGYSELFNYWVANTYQLRYTGGMVPLSPLLQYLPLHQTVIFFIPCITTLQRNSLFHFIFIFQFRYYVKLTRIHYQTALDKIQRHPNLILIS